jgi:hypothetical protein
MLGLKSAYTEKSQLADHHNPMIIHGNKGYTWSSQKTLPETFAGLVSSM